MKLLLHVCCANCAVIPVKMLRKEGLTAAGFWFNPNIHPSREHTTRLNALKDFAGRFRFEVLYHDYVPAEFFKIFKAAKTRMKPILETKDITGEETIPRTSGGERPAYPFPERCGLCYRVRLEETAVWARREKFDAFSTTLLISPYQNHEKIITAGNDLAEQYNIDFYHRDFRPYFREAMAYAKNLGLYRQKYCGCVYSGRERAQRLRGNAAQKSAV